jgi:hypothetical protein
VVYKTLVPDNRNVKVKCTMAKSNNITLKPGSMVVTKRHTIENVVHLESLLSMTSDLLSQVKWL